MYTVPRIHPEFHTVPRIPQKRIFIKCIYCSSFYKTRMDYVGAFLIIKKDMLYLYLSWIQKPLCRHTRNFNFGYPVFLKKILDSQPLAENDSKRSLTLASYLIRWQKTRCHSEHPNRHSEFNSESTFLLYCQKRRWILNQVQDNDWVWQDSYY